MKLTVKFTDEGNEFTVDLISFLRALNINLTEEQIYQQAIKEIYKR